LAVKRINKINIGFGITMYYRNYYFRFMKAKANKPTSIRIPEILKLKLIKKATKESRDLSSYIIYILNRYGK